MTPLPSTSANDLVVVTHFPSPYQVELFDSIERLRPGALKVFYLHRSDSSRSWRKAELLHRAAHLTDAASRQSARDAITTARVVIFNYYQDVRALALIRRRAATGRAWCYWGERPGFRQGALGRWGRRLMLGPLHASRAPIWGIGSWAVDAYRAEFGPDHAYANIPYFSNLDRYQLTAPQPGTRELTFLYSGSLVHRKGVDLLARAFARLAQETPNVRLRIMGEGALEPDLKRILATHASRVDWVGFKDWRDLPAEYAACQVLCAPSRHDGWGLVVPEGLAAGLPVISTDRTGAAIDLIEPGVNGWRIPAGSEDALFEAMRGAAGLTAGAWLAMSQRARARMSTHSLADGTMKFLAAADGAADAVTAPS